MACLDLRSLRHVSVAHVSRTALRSLNMVISRCYSELSRGPSRRSTVTRTTEPLKVDGASAETNSAIPKSVYVHIPFCRRRCRYCDFTIHVLGKNSHETIMDEYVDSLISEIHRSTPSSKPRIDTLYFGGGTPSLLSVNNFGRVMEAIHSSFDLNDECEVTVEMDPGTFCEKKMEGFVNLGQTRASLGLQSLNPKQLSVAGRAHGVEETLQSLELIKNAGLKSWSVDILCGLPGETLVEWEKTLKAALDFAPPHISAYDLTIEKDTRFERMVQTGEIVLPTEQVSADVLRRCSEILRQNNYQRYEVSSFALEGHRSKHNSIYWRRLPFFGFGVGATSLNPGRYTRPKTIAKYKRWVEACGWLEAHSTSDVPDDEILEEKLILALRTTDGVNLGTIFGEKKLDQAVHFLRSKEFQSCYNVGWVEVFSSDRHTVVPEDLTNALEFDDKLSLHHYSIRLTDPEGFLFASTVMVELTAAMNL